jgi:hypothetical protein
MKAYKKSEEVSCRICGVELSGKNLTNHIKKEHNLDSQTYTVKYILDGIDPKCPICGIQPRYVALSFKKYCKDHSKVAEKMGGCKGGKAEAWNKGKTKETDDRIKLQSQSVMGSGNHFYGRSHSEETIRSISLTKTLSIDDVRKRFDLHKNEFELMTPLTEYKARHIQNLKIKCQKCCTMYTKSLKDVENGFKCDCSHT